MNDLQFAGRRQCLPIRCSGRLISLQNEHPIDEGTENISENWDTHKTDSVSSIGKGGHENNGQQGGPAA
jgi:hypothetical protein